MSPSEIRTTAPRRTRRRGTSSRASSAPRLLGTRRRRIRRDDLSAAHSARARTQHGEGGRRDGPAGTSTRGSGRAAVAAARRHADASRPGSRSASRTRSTQLAAKVAPSSRPATGASRSRSSPAGTSTWCRRARRASPTIPLMVDANAAYTLADVELWPRLDAFGLMMIEQPLDYDDIVEHARAAAAAKDADLPGRIDPQSARSRATAIDARRVPHHQHQAGPRGRLRRIDPRCTTCARRTGVPVWCGGMLETGIGRAHNIHLAYAAQFHAAGRRRRQQALFRSPT